MAGVLLTALLALVSVPRAQALWLGRLDPQQLRPHGLPGPGLPDPEDGPGVGGTSLPYPLLLHQLLGSWYVVAVASGERDFAVEKATKNIEGVVVTLTPENNLKMLASRHRLERCHLHTVELLKQNSGWVFGNPSLGVLEYRVLGTNFRDYAVVFTQLELADEAFGTVELYSRTELASQEAMSLFTKWSKGLGFLSQQQATLQRDRECRLVLGDGAWGHSPASAGPGDPPGLREPGRGLQGVTSSLPKVGLAGLAPVSVTCAHKAFQVSSLPEHPRLLGGGRGLGLSGPLLSSGPAAVQAGGRGS
ncbi:Epididymal-specific lipocalin-6 [Camelus dromedarius]|uniref:Epididymal-specific lipocalin-6 n=2 Tax=Artiodactyla TaxID=91561 RepID=A0A5N4E9R7_CAMDR|nr:Epididymal-specific lipocalin-6 [Camelus dromedarius]